MNSHSRELQNAAQESYAAHVKLIPFVVHDTVVYRSATTDTFAKVFKSKPLDKTIVQNFVNTYIPEKYSRTGSGKLLNVNLNQITELQDTLIALHKLGYQQASLSEFSINELEIILVVLPNFAKHIQPFIQHLESESVKAQRSNPCTDLMNYFYSFFNNKTYDEAVKINSKSNAENVNRNIIG